MEMMRAAVVASFDQPPHYEEVPIPRAADADHQLVDVLAVGLHPRVRSGASGQHYTSTGMLPMIPGVDGVGRLPDGTVIYFVVDDEVPGSMADKAVVDRRRSVTLPEEADVVGIAAAMNPAMSAWVALRRRVPIEPGHSVLVLGATGNAGTMAVRVAALLGAGRVIGAGRNLDRLHALTDVGADAVVVLTGRAEADAAALGKAAADVDIVIDYLWGKPAEVAIMALLSARADRSRAMDWIQIGAVAGPTIELPSVALRSANFRLQGNGQGAVSPAAYLAELPSLIAAIAAGHLGIATRTAPLAAIESVWSAPEVPGVRTVVVP